MQIAIVERVYDPWQRIGEYARAQRLDSGGSGAVSVFVGTMRDFNEGANVEAMTLEHYPGMTDLHLERIARQAQERWSLNDVLVIHRVGRILPGDSIVTIATWSAHRSEAFAACRFIIEELKSRAPFWKRERVPEGERWVRKNTAAAV